jgi:excisionase family DNA binding protein
LSDSAPQELLTTKAAAVALGVTQQTVRNWIDSGKLKGTRSGRPYQVTSQSVEQILAQEGKRTLAPRHRSQTEIDALAKEVRRLADQSAAVAALASERDRYRAEAATLREAAAQVNAASREAYAGMRQLLDAMQLQSEALSQLLGPSTPDDVLRR